MSSLRQGPGPSSGAVSPVPTQPGTEKVLTKYSSGLGCMSEEASGAEEGGQGAGWRGIVKANVDGGLSCAGKSAELTTHLM